MPPEFPTISDQSLPPQNIEAEESILGGILLDPEAIARVAETLTPEAFYLQAHQTIYRAAIALYEQKKPTDLMTISTWLADQELLDKVGGKAKLAQLADRTVSAVNIDGYAQLVLDKYVRRQLINAGHKIVQLGFDTTEGLNLVLDRAEQSIFQITQDRPQSGLIPLSETLLETFDQIEGLYYEDQLPGINTGFYDLDSMTSGLQPSDLLILAGRPSMGKCLGKGTKVVMFDGTLKAVENIQVNDQLMGPDSKPRKVLSLARGREMMYWVCQKRGVDYRVNESHILSLKASGSEGRRVHGEVVNMSVQDYLTKSQKFQQRHKGYKVAIDFPPQIVPIDPYLLGLWLGDGKLGDSRIFNIADEVIAELGVIAVREGYRLSHQPNGDRCDSWNLCAGENPEGFKIQLRRAQLLDQKWIPLCYLANTKEVRLELLAGLMDSDGYYCKDMQCFENTQKSKKLAEQIKFLADSLGFRTSIIRKQGSIKTSNFCGEYWRVRVSGNLEIIPTRIQYKKARNYASGRDWQVTGITIEPDGVDYYYGFELDGDGLFLLEDMTVTHNTAFGLNIARNIAGKYQLPVALFSLEMSKEQLSQRLLASEAKIESNRLRSGRLSGQDYQKLSDAIGTLSAIPIYIDDTATLTVMEMRSQARRLQAEQGQLGLVLLDYLQLMEGGGDNRVQELSRITRSLKTLAREIKAPVIALSQLSRGVEQRTNKRPMLSDLRESGCLTGDSLVTIADTGEEVPIKDLVGHSGFNVFALNLETWKLEKAPVSKVFSTGVKPTLELTTALGRKIIATGNHKFLTLDQGWVRLDELKEGDYIANPQILRLGTSDVYWDKIASITPTDESSPVYDLTVPKLHNFVANNIIVHNSIEQDADLVLMLYRDAYYNPDTPDRDLAEVIITKHRNGPTGTVKLLFNAELTEFRNLARNE